MNSYRGNGGGELLTKGGGHPEKNRVFCLQRTRIYAYLMQYIEKKGKVDAQPLNRGRWCRRKWTVPAAKREAESLFLYIINRYLFYCN